MQHGWGCRKLLGGGIMSDEADIASNAEELFRSAQLARIRALAGIKIKPSRVCLNCGEKTRKPNLI